MSRLVSLSKHIYRLFRRTTEEFLDDNCPSMAAATAFYVLLTLFPLALAGVSILGIVLGSPDTRAWVIENLTKALPVSRDFIQDTAQGVVNARGPLGIAAILGLLWGSMALFSILRKSLNAAFGVTMPQPYFMERLREFLMMLGAGLLLFISLSSSTFFSLVRQSTVETHLPGLLHSPLLWAVAGSAGGLALTFLTFLLFYKFVPYVKLPWRDLWLGAFLGSLGFELGKFGFAFYVDRYINYNVLYGAVGAMVIFLIWVYISVLVLLYGAEFASTYHRFMAARRAALRSESQGAAALAGPPRPRALTPATIFLGLVMVAVIGFDTLRRLIVRKA